MWPFSEQKLTGIHRLGDTGKVGGWTPDKPSIKDWPLRLSKMAASPIPPQSPDRRELGQNGPVVDQGDLGSCVGCSTAYGVAFLRRTDRDKLSTLYSALFQYYTARVADGEQWRTVDAGANIRDSMDQLRKVGIAPVARWPYIEKKFAVTPTASVYKAAAAWKLGAHWLCESLEDMQRALAQGCALVGGISVYDSMMTDQVAQTGAVPMPSRSEKLLGGHALYFDRYDTSSRLFRFQNSWGPRWGDQGYGYIPFEYLADTKLADDFWAMSCEAPETTPWKD